MRKAVVIGLIIGVFLVTLLVPRASVSAYQFEPPLADRFTFHYPPPRQMDTTEYDSAVEMFLEYWAGYDCYLDTDCGVNVATIWMQYDAIFSFVGHGYQWGGILWFWNKSSFSKLVASRQIPEYNYSDCYHEFLEDVGDLWDLRLMALVGCCTSKRYSATRPRTSLTDMAVIKGVDCALGFEDPLLVICALPWDYYFWYWLCIYGYTVDAAAQTACDYVLYFYGSYGGTDSKRISGDKYIKIVPPGYGS